MAKIFDNSPAGRMPFTKGFDDGMMLSNGVYSYMYSIDKLTIQSTFMEDLTEFFSNLPDKYIYQIVVHNRTIDENEYLKKVLIKEEKPFSMPYNRMIMDNSKIGHNNIKKCVYFLVGTTAANEGAARTSLDEFDKDLAEKFPAESITKMTIYQRYESLYYAFNPTSTDFGNILDINNEGKPSLANLKYLKLTEKQLVAPKKWDTSQMRLDVTLINEGMDAEFYTRTLFLSGIPSVISPNVANDLSSACSNMILSVHFRPVSTKPAFDKSNELVKANLKVVKQAKRDSLQEKKNRATVDIAHRIKATEADYFNECALNTIKEVVAEKGCFMQTDFIITLYGKTEDDVDRATDLLKISASKYACSVKPLDLVQYEAFVSSLPLCDLRTNTSRFLDTKKVVGLSLISAAEVQKKGQYQGLNTINDNLVMLDRKGNNAIGCILGCEHSGKTTQFKREIYNRMIATDDVINIITYDESLISFVEKFDGVVNYIPAIDVLKNVPQYGVTKTNESLKKMFLNALLDDAQSDGENKESNILLSEFELSDYDPEAVMRYVFEHEDTLPIINKVYKGTEKIIGKHVDNKVNLYLVHNATEMLLLIDYLWNQAVDFKRNNIDSSIFIDGVDELLKTSAGNSYLCRILNQFKSFRNSATVVVQDSVGLIMTTEYSVELDYMLENCGYVKILNLGPIERSKFTETLNIPNALTSFITSVEPSKGLIITNTSNITFNDNFMEPDSEFMKIFLE